MRELSPFVCVGSREVRKGESLHPHKLTVNKLLLGEDAPKARLDSKALTSLDARPLLQGLQGFIYKKPQPAGLLQQYYHVLVKHLILDSLNRPARCYLENLTPAELLKCWLPSWESG